MESGSDFAPELTEEEFEAWMALPATRAICRYLSDKAMAARISWALGGAQTVEDRARVEDFEDMAALEYADIRQFYEDLADKTDALRAGRTALRHFEREDDDRDDHTA